MTGRRAQARLCARILCGAGYAVGLGRPLTRKPNVDVLLEICRDQNCTPEETAYVGDSLARDVLMAHDAGVFSIWAKYGVSHDTEDYERLVRITHWTQEDIEREKMLRGRTRSLQPNLILERSFGEILPAFSVADVA
jgi:phosphoglycolate phosphatase